MIKPKVVWGYCRGRGRDGRVRSTRGLVGWAVRPEAPEGVAVVG